MQHFIVTHINPTMAHPRRVISTLEKDEIAGLRIAGRRTDVIEPLGPQAAHIPAGMIDHPGHIAGAVKGCGRVGASPHIGTVYEAALARRELLHPHSFPLA